MDTHDSSGPDSPGATPLAAPATDPTSPPPSRSALRRLVLSSLLAGLCPLIPLPFLDDWARDLLRERLTLDLGRRHDHAFDTPTVVALTGTRQGISARGCLQSMLLRPVFYLIKKFFRKVLFFLTIKDCIDTFSRTFHESYLLRHALVQGHLKDEAKAVPGVRLAITDVLKQVDPRPVEKITRAALKGSRHLLRQTAGQLGRLLRSLRRRNASRERLFDHLELRPEEESLAGITEEITTALEAQRGYFRELEERFERHIASGGNDPEKAPNTHRA